MTSLSRTRLAAVCAALSTAAVAGMVAVTVLAGGGTCGLAGCAPAAEFVVATTSGVVDGSANACATPTTTRPAAVGPARRGPCTPSVREPSPTGAMATARVPAP